MADISRREFAALAALATAAPFARAGKLSAAQASTAGQLIERIKTNIGVEWNPDSVDTLKAGDSSTAVTGIVTTSMASLAVLQRAVKDGANFIVTAEPTFYGRADSPTPPTGRGAPAPAQTPPDLVFAAKNDFITSNGLVVFRLGEHWRQHQPDPFAQGIAEALRWSKYQSANDPQRFDIPVLRLDAVASSVKNALNARGGIRVVGDPGTRVQRVGVLPGTTPIQAALKMLPEVDAIIAGEVREWESVEYARDTVFSGASKALILVGRIVSEEPGMSVCASWLQTLAPELPIRHISAGDPYWRPS